MIDKIKVIQFEISIDHDNMKRERKIVLNKD